MTLASDTLSGAEPVSPTFKTEGGVILNMPPADLTIVFDDPKLPQLRTKQIAEVAEGSFSLNGITRYWAACDGERCIVCGWGDGAIQRASVA